MANLNNLDKLSIHKLALFNEVVINGSLRKAALISGISPQRLHYELKIIEKIIGTPLYSTTNNRIALTDEGKNFASFAKEVLNLYSFKGIGRVKKSDETLIIASTYGVNEIFLSDILLNFRHKFPSLRYKVLAGKEYMDFSSYEVDIVLGPKLANRPELSQKSLVDFSYYLYGSEEYLNNHGIPIAFSDIQKHKLLVFSQDQSAYIETLPLTNNYIESNCYRFLFKLAQEGLGLIPLTEDIIKHYGNNNTKMIKVIPGSPCEIEKFFFIYHKHSEKLHLINKFQEACFEHFIS